MLFLFSPKRREEEGKREVRMAARLGEARGQGLVGRAVAALVGVPGNQKNKTRYWRGKKKREREREPLISCYFKARGTALLKACGSCSGKLGWGYYYLQNRSSFYP